MIDCLLAINLLELVWYDREIIRYKSEKRLNGKPKERNIVKYENTGTFYSMHKVSRLDALAVSTRPHDFNKWPMVTVIPNACLI